MQWLNELPFADNRVLQIGFLAACGIAALIVLAIVYRLTFAHRLRVPGGRTRQPRLGLVDAFSLDGQRQLVLIRRDNIEHLVMIGGPNDVLVESQINRAAVPARESNQARRLCLCQATPVRQLLHSLRRRLQRSLNGSASAEGRRQGPGLGARHASPGACDHGCAGRPNRGCRRPALLPLRPPRRRRFRQPPTRRQRRFRFTSVRSRPGIRARTGAASRLALRPRRRKPRPSPPDLRRRVRRRVRRTRGPHSRVRRCPRRSFPPMPRRTAGLPSAHRKQRSPVARAILRPRLPAAPSRRAAQAEEL